ncbi:DUF2254 domain-containing protein [Leekyejoonella antrihumi]|uniref:DUF2254 domain-containing protein n=1 Tax=Leekyejoonella antrihumi TaxID=1660198 RepID=A0A563DY75_9MICO|nr:DUF2254 family protein [Leekyejoonella antrihumi]TWP35210.1 DUF2254 domain-containing protein [Leekyejoonella antrihumi]
MRRDAVKEYVSGSLWVLPTACAVGALSAGYALSHVYVGPHSTLDFLAFQGTADDARSLLVTITGTVVTVIALVLGLTVVALQLSSTQFSPRLLRNFLRDRATQFVLSVFLATFSYSTAGLYTVGVASGARVQAYPRLAVSGAIVLLFVSLAMVVFYANHLAHSIQIDSIARKVELSTLSVVRRLPKSVDESAVLTPPDWAIPLLSSRSGYLQTDHADDLLPLVRDHGVSLLVRLRVGEHVVAGTPLAWAWAKSPDDRPPDAMAFGAAIEARVRVGFERTMEQDAAFGIRQLVDIACKALSPAVNDPYTAVQAIDHLSVIFCALAVRPLGPVVRSDPTGCAVVLPARNFADYLSTMCGLIRRYGASEPTVSVALLRLLESCAAVLPSGHPRRADLASQGQLILTDADREVANPADRLSVQTAAQRLRETAG